MSTENIRHLQKFVAIMFGNKLNGREIQLINDYIECAYLRGRLDECKENTDGIRRLADTSEGAQDATH